MASLEDLLKKTMLFVAADGYGIDAFRNLRRAPTDPVAFSRPIHDPATEAKARAVWHWTHDPQNPAKISSVEAFVSSAGPKGMTMPVCSIELERLTVTREGNPAVQLPLRPEYVLAKFFLRAGKVTARQQGWWQLEANVDASLLVVFGYELIPASGVDPKPLKMERVERLGKRFFPTPDVPSDDPDAPLSCGPEDALALPAIARAGESVTVYVSPTWVIVAFGLTTCKQRTDSSLVKCSAPGGFTPMQWSRATTISPEPNANCTSFDRQRRCRTTPRCSSIWERS